MIASDRFVTNRRHALSFQADSCTRLCSRSNSINNITIHCLNAHISAKCCNTKRNRCIRKNIHIPTLESWISGYDDFHKQISSWSAIFTRFSVVSYPYALTIINTSRNIYHLLNSLCDVTIASTIRTFFFYNFTCSLTIWTSLYILHHAKQRLLGIYYLTFSATFCTGLW